MIPSSYSRLLRSAGVARLAVAFLALGIATTMTPVAFVLFARAATGSFASASLVLAASTAGGLLFGPARGRLVDRQGARRAVLALVVPDVLTDIAFIVAGQEHTTAAILVILAFLAGAATAPASAALRTAWSKLLTDDETRHAGFALMTVLQETTFIAGPLVAGVAIALGSAADAVAVSAVLSFAGALTFATGLEPSPVMPHKPRSGRLPALAGAGIRTVVVTAAAFGLTFGILDVAFPAFAHARGAAAVSGVLLSAFAAGSWIGGFAHGLRPRAASPGRRYPRLCLLAGLGLAPLIAAVNLPVMVILAAISGLCFAPITTTQIAVVDDVAEPEHTAEAFTWLGTMYGTGLAVGAALSGQLITAVGIRLALAVACGATLLAWLVAMIRSKTLSRAPDEADPGRRELAAR